MSASEVRTRPDAIREMPRLFYLASCHGSGGAPAEPAAPHAQPATRESKLFDEAALARIEAWVKNGAKND